MELTSTGVKKTYNADEKMSSQAKGYCICGANKRNWSFKGPMIQCDICRKWYHFKCINLELFSDPDDETHFECGMKDCKSSSLNIKFADMTNYPLVKKELQEAKSVPEKQVITKENFALQLGLTPIKLSDESVCMHEQEHCESFTQKSSSAEETIWKESSSDSITQIQSVGSTFNIEMGKESNCEESISNESSPQNEASSDTNLLYDYNMVGLHEKNLNTDFHIPNRNEYERNSASSNRIKEAHKEFSIHHKKIIKYVKKLSDNKIGDLNNKERIYIEEMLIQELEFLDGLDCHNFQPLKQQRKNLIDLINSGLDQIEFFNKEGQIDFTPKIDEKIDEIENKLNQVNKCVDDNFENARAFGTEDENKIMESNDKNDSVGLMDKKNKELSDTFKKYRMHHKECLKLIERVTCTSMDNKAKKYIEEMLVQKVDILNGLDCYALIELKNNRNQLICMINKTLDQLESQNQEKEQDAERSITLSMRKENNYNSDTSLNTKGTSSSQSITQKLEKIAFEDNIESGDESDCDRETMFSKSTISSVLGYEIPNSEYFTKELDKKSSFHLDTNIYDQLYQQKKNRYFKRGTWESYYVKGLKVSNPFCVFRFEHHHISTAVKKDNRRIFFASAACTFSGCPVKAKLEMFDKTLVTVNYTGNIKHHVNEQHSRYIRAEERKELKEEFKGGIKPLTKYLEVVKKHTPEELVSGNIDGFGKNSRVYAQIACESRQEARRSDNILSSLLSQQHDMKKDCPTGFIQKICAKPLYVIYWSKGGLALYHERAASNALFWDATGSVCRRSDDGKQMLYYELAIRHPVKGKMGIPVTAMVSSDQSLPIISDWLKSFRHGEKKQFGYNKVVTPKLIISDQAMVFILAALQEFNGEDMNSFLSRAWDIINEKSPYDPSKTLVHLCASYFMNTCKKYIEKKVGKKNKAAYLYMIGLLMNCRSIHDAGEILLDIFVILQSPTLNNVNISNYDRLKRKINSYETSSEQFGINEPTGINDCSDTNTNTNLFTEEEYQAAGTSSKFREWANNVAQKAQLITDKMDCSQPTSNSWYSPDFYQYLKNKLMPIYPLWSLILMTIPGFNLDIVKTNSTVENRFRILKYIGLNSRSQYRIDEFSDALYTQTVAIQKLSCLESLKFRSNVKLTRKKNI